MEKNYENNQKTNNKMSISTWLLIITSNVKRLMLQTKDRSLLIKKKKKTKQTACCYRTLISDLKTHTA